MIDARSWGRHGHAVSAALEEAEASRVAERIWARDASLWSDDSAVQATIAKRLGWLAAPAWARERLPEFHALAADARGFTHVVLLGMGGSSLAPEVIAATYGAAASRPLTVLDSTDPDEVAAVTDRVDERTLFIIASKSGETIETRSHAAYFYNRVGSGDRFIAITDPGSPLESFARDRDFRHVFLNPPDIGGRYSALSYFGLVPSSAIGIDVEGIVRASVDAADASRSAEDNPSLAAGVGLGELARQGYDKATFLPSGGLDVFGTWAEQLLAESTGKNGRGIVPVHGEPLGPLDAYGDDRVFVWLDGSQPVTNEAVDAFDVAGYAELLVGLAQPEALGAAFFDLEFATAVAGWRLGINPFDEPNVSESKQNTARLIEAYERDGRLPGTDGTTTSKDVASFVEGAKPGDYVALQAFVPRNDGTSKALRELRSSIRDRLHVATTAGFGPRFLHSTGQLHKGGPDTGLFVQITTNHANDVAIPGAAYSFGVLQVAQAAGDFDSLRRHERRAIRIHLTDVESGLTGLARALRDELT